MRNKIQQFQDKLKVLRILIEEIREEFDQNGEKVTPEIYSISDHLSTLYKEIYDLLSPLCKDKFASMMKIQQHDLNWRGKSIARMIYTIYLRRK